MSNIAVKERLVSVLNAFERGDVDISALQQSWLDHASALEAVPDGFHDRVIQIEGKLEHIRFMCDDGEQRARAAELIPQMRRELEFV